MENQIVGFWNESKEKLNVKYPIIAEENLNFHKNKKRDARSAGYKSEKTQPEHHTIINIINTSILAILLFFTSCASNITFPTSGVTPAADITATKKAEKNGNFRISITAKNLASADRLEPPQSVYIAWIVTNTEGTKSIGRLTNKNAKTATLETLTPYTFTEIFITAEGQADISYPSGPEITRAKFKK